MQQVLDLQSLTELMLHTVEPNLCMLVPLASLPVHTESVVLTHYSTHFLQQIDWHVVHWYPENSSHSSMKNRAKTPLSNTPPGPPVLNNPASALLSRTLSIRVQQLLALRTFLTSLAKVQPGGYALGRLWSAEPIVWFPCLSSPEKQAYTYVTCASRLSEPIFMLIVKLQPLVTMMRAKNEVRWHSVKSKKAWVDGLVNQIQNFNPGDHCPCPVWNRKSEVTYFNVFTFRTAKYRTVMFLIQTITFSIT